MELMERIWPKNDDGSWKKLHELDVLDYIMLGEYGIDPGVFEDMQFIYECVLGRDE